jgi:hypothetical protein
MEMIGFSGMLVTIYKTAGFNSPEHHIPDFYSCENLKSHRKHYDI